MSLSRSDSLLLQGRLSSLPIAGFKPVFFGLGNDCSAANNRSTTTTPTLVPFTQITNGRVPSPQSSACRSTTGE